MKFVGFVLSHCSVKVQVSSLSCRLSSFCKKSSVLFYFCWHILRFGHKQSSACISGLWLVLSRWGAVSGGFCSHPKRAPLCQSDHCVRIQENRHVVVIAGQAGDTLVEADTTYYTSSQRAVLFCFDWTNICVSIMRLHLQTRAEQTVRICFPPFHLSPAAPRLPSLLQCPPSIVFNIKVRCLTRAGLKQRLFCWISLQPARNDKNLSTLVQLEKKMKRVKQSAPL